MSLTSVRLFGTTASIKTLGQGLGSAMLLAILILPRSVMEVAARIGYEMHVVSFVIGPATYRYGQNLIPGVDYFTQYSVGLPYLFGFFLQGSADAAILTYVRWIVAAMLGFYAGLYFLLRWLYRSSAWALFTTLTILILQFHVERTFFDPSSYVLRYPLLVVAVAAVTWWIHQRQSAVSGCIVALVSAVSLFLNSETGIYQLLATAFVGFFASGPKLRRLAIPGAVVAGAVVIFYLLCLLAFGPAVFDAPFTRGLFEPFAIYGGGYGGWSIDWRWGMNVLYNVISPGLVLATMAWGARRLWISGDDQETGARIAAVLMFAALGIMMSAKYINMSIIGLWLVNSLGFIVTIAWWARCFSQWSRSGASLTELRILGRALGALLLVSATTVLWTVNDPRNPAAYALQAYSHYPSLMNALLRRIPREGCRELNCAAPRISPADVEMIARLVPLRERVAIFGWYDWVYLIEARRASWFQFLPTQVLFTQAQLRAAADLPDVVILPNDSSADIGIKHVELKALLVPKILRDYERIEVGRDLVAWRKKRSNG